MRFFWIAVGLMLCLTIAVQAQKVEVPSTIHFADMRLDLSPAARKKIQTDVDALLRSEKYFLLKLEKVDAYFPLIEQALKEEKVPEDIKYLVIQESALVGDAVSTSNAIGYWQFKEPAAREVGLTINHAVDERMNIMTATRGAARYFKNNNAYFDNWLYAVLAYNTGPGGALKIANKSQYGKKHMKLEGDTHWYVLKFLAHKIAFENAVGKNPHPKIQLFVYAEGNGKTLAQIAEKFNLKEADLEPYNRWLKSSRIPDDKQYYVVIPNLDGHPDEELLAEAKPAKNIEDKVQLENNTSYQSVLTKVEDTKHFPVIREFDRRGAEVKINGIPGIIAREGDNIRKISQRTGVSTSHIVSFNDLISKESAIIPGQPYYIKRKRNRGAARYHITEPGETLWSISQRFGLKLKKLIRNNRLEEEENIKPGRVLWLRYIRPSDFPVEYRDALQQQDKPQRKTKITALNHTEPSKIDPVAPSETNSFRKESQEEPVNAQSYESWESVSASGTKEESTKSGSEDTIQPSSSVEQSTDASTEEELAFQDSEGVTFVETTHIEEAPVPDYHIVQKGETFYSIARKYQLTIPQLKEYNSLSTDASLATGQKLMLKTPEQSPKKPTEIQSQSISYIYHKVQVGETLYKVARSYDVTIKDLMEWNNKDNFNVSVGEQLKIANPSQK